MGLDVTPDSKLLTPDSSTPLVEVREYFSPVNRMWYILDELRDLHSSMGREREDYRQLWKSREFLEKNGWTLGQRVERKIRDLIRKALAVIGIHIRTYKDQ